MRWDRISLLLDSMEDDLVKQGYAAFDDIVNPLAHLCISYFHLDANQAEPVKLQTGVIRTNCMDNLDRTNVTQAAFAKWTLDRQLKAMGVMAQDDTIDRHEDLQSLFRHSESCDLTVA